MIHTNGYSQQGIENHKSAAKHHELAAMYHYEAVKYHEEGNHEQAFESTIQAHGHHELANEHQKRYI